MVFRKRLRKRFRCFSEASGSPSALQLFERKRVLQGGRSELKGKTEILTPGGEKPRSTPDSAE